jgi:hypothetical protein
MFAPLIITGRCRLLSVLTLSAAALALWSSAARAEIKTDYGVHAAPAVTPTLPAAGQTFTDPVFGTTILRVTGPADGNDNITAYSYWPSFNRNSTRIRYYSNGVPKLATFNPATMQLSNKRDLFLSNSPDGFKPVWDDVIWSGSDPNVIYGHTKLNIWAYNVEANAYSLVHNFANDGFPAGNIQQMSKSKDDNVFAFTLQDNNYARTGHIAWRRNTNQIQMHRTDAGNVNEVQVDKSGRYVLIHTEQQGAGKVQARVTDLHTGTTTDLIDNTHFAPGHGDSGHGINVAHENWNNRIMGRSLANPTQPYQIFQLPDWDQSQHISMLADDESWALVSNFGSGNGAFDNELFLVATDGSGAVKRFAHHESDYSTYYDSPRADISADGRFVTFTSNWGNSGRRDVFVVAIPEPTAIALLAPLALLAPRRSRRVAKMEEGKR